MTSKRTPDSVRREHLRKELSELRLRTIPAVDMSTGGFVPLAIPGLRSIALDRSPGQSVFAALRALIADAIDGVGVIVGMEDRAAGAARILFGLDDQPPLDRRRRAAELYDAERYITAQGKFGKSESDKWRQYGEREVLDQLAG